MNEPFSWSPYTERFYTGQMEDIEGREIDNLAKALFQVLGPKFVADVGCGRGRFLSVFKNFGCFIWGTDGAPAKKAGLLFPEKCFSEQDFRNGLIMPKKADLVLCLEVVEHLPPDTAKTLVRQICRSGAKYIAFSGAHPGQGGTGHINERSAKYWVAEFVNNDRQHDRPLTRHVIEVWNTLLGAPVTATPWYEANLRIFRT